MSKRKITYIHIFIWLFTIFANLPYAMNRQQIGTRDLVSIIIGFLYLMVVFYLFYLVLTPVFINKKKPLEFFLLSFITVLIMPFFGYTILFLSRAFFEGTFHNFYRDYSLRMHMSAFYPVMTAAVFGSFFRVIINWFTVINQKAEIEKQKLSAELELLKSKLHPHFLFNTLNNIDSLIQSNPEAASAALLRLSDMMRYLTYETSLEFVELKKEVEYIRNYIELNRIRIKTPEDIKLEISGNLDLKISPALFVPLIENAFKFADYRSRKPFIEIQLSTADGIVIFDISNICRKNSNNSGLPDSGFGIINLRKRLDLVYPNRYQLTFNKSELQYEVILKIDTNAN